MFDKFPYQDCLRTSIIDPADYIIIYNWLQEPKNAETTYIRLLGKKIKKLEKKLESIFDKHFLPNSSFENDVREVDKINSSVKKFNGVNLYIPNLAAARKTWSEHLLRPKEEIIEKLLQANSDYPMSLLILKSKLKAIASRLKENPPNPGRGSQISEIEWINDSLDKITQELHLIILTISCSNIVSKYTADSNIKQCFNNYERDRSTTMANIKKEEVEEENK